MAAGSPVSQSAAHANISTTQPGPVKKMAAIADVAGGATVDAESRTAINALLAALRTAGMLTS